MDFDNMKNMQIKDIDINTLVDIRDVSVSKDLPKEKRIEEFVRQIKNPFCYRCGKFVVKASFAENGFTMEDCLKSIIL